MSVCLSVSVSLATQTPWISWKSALLYVMFSTFFSLLGYPNKTQSLVFDISITCWTDEIWRVYICTLTWASCSLTGFTSFSSRFVLSNLTPQLISKPTPPITKLKSILLKLTSIKMQHHWISTVVRVLVLQPKGSRFKSSPKCHIINWNLFYGKMLPPFLLICNFRKQNTRRNVSPITAC